MQSKTVSRRVLLVPVLTGVLLAVGACSAAGADGESSSAQVEKYCAQTECSREKQLCEEHVEYRCNDCTDTCFEIAQYSSNFSCLDTCDRICSSQECSIDCDKDSSCEQYSFRVTLPRISTESSRACVKALETVGECTDLTTTEKEFCDAASQVFTADLWECFEAESCDGDLDSCVTDRKGSTVGSETCKTFEARCPDAELSCNPDFGMEYRPEIAELARQCWAQDCEDVELCLDSLTAAIDAVGN